MVCTAAGVQEVEAATASAFELSPSVIVVAEVW